MWSSFELLIIKVLKDLSQSCIKTYTPTILSFNAYMEKKNKFYNI